MFIRILLLLTMFFTSIASASYSTPSKSRAVNPKVGQFLKHKETIIEASQLSGMSVESITAIASHESGIGLNTKNPHSNVKGVMQFTDRTWNSERKQFAKTAGLPANVSVHNPRANILIGSMGMAEDKAYLQKHTKVKQVTDGDVFMSRFVGRYGATKILNGDPNAPISKYVKLAKGNGGMYYVKGRVVTVKEFRQKMDNIMTKEKNIHRKQLNQTKLDMFMVGLANDRPADLVLATL